MLKSDYELSPKTYSLKGYKKRGTTSLKKVFIISSTLVGIAAAVGFGLLIMAKII